MEPDAPLRLREAAGVLDDEDAGWVRLTGNPKRDLSPLKQDRMIAVCHFLYDQNPIAKWLLETLRDFIVGEGTALKAEDEDVQEVLTTFWEDPINSLDINLPQMVLELFLYGEALWPVFVNSASGLVRLATVDPSQIKAVTHDPDNAAIPIGVTLKGRAGRDGKRLRVLYPAPDEELFPKAAQRLRRAQFTDGECFWFKMNSVRTATRGRSDLFALADWLDGYEQFLFNTLDRTGFLNAFVWDVKLTGVDDAGIRQWQSLNPAPKPGSVFAHNENIEMNAVTPDLKGADTTDHARLFRNQILGGSGIPEHWLGGAGDVNLACYSEDTETLTIEGWKPYDAITEETLIAAYDPADTQIHFVPAGPLSLYDYDGEMVHFKTKNTDILVTPNHRMYGKARHPIEKQHLEAYRFITADALADWKGRERQWRFRTVASWEGDYKHTVHISAVRTELGSRAFYPDLEVTATVFLEFLGYWISEGHTRERLSDKRGYEVGLSQKAPVKAEKIRKCLAKLSAFTWSERQDKDGTFRWSTGDRGLYMWLRQHCGLGSLTRRLPPWTMQIATRQARILFNALVLGDGHWYAQGQNRARSGYYCSMSKVLIGDVQCLATRLGYRTGIWQDTRETKSQIYMLYFTPNLLEVSLRPRNIQRVPYRGKVYCFNVPTGLFVTRRNGKIAIQGNTAQAMGAPTFKRFQSRQRLVKYILTLLGRYQIEQAVQAGELARDVDRTFQVIFPQLQAEDLSRIGPALQQLAAACTQAEDRGWIQPGTSQQIFAAVAGRLGVEVPLSAPGELEAERPVTQDYRRNGTPVPAGNNGASREED